MSELTHEGTTNTYRAFINEVFIAPIRTAVVVDDEYPTLDELLSDISPLAVVTEAERLIQKNKKENWPRVRDILGFCRNRTPTPWLVDVHDGKTPSLDRDEDSASHLDYSDLLILDYHLESNSSNQKALQILQRLARNGHFNLVVVYTREREEAGAGIDRTINDIALSLASPVDSLCLNVKKVTNLEDRFSSWDDIQENIYNDLTNSLDQSAFLKILEQGDMSWDAVRKMPELGTLSGYLNSIPSDVSLSAGDIYALLMHKRQAEYRDQMAKVPCGYVTTGRAANGVNWIRTDSLFITVISKEHEASTIPDRLLNALEAWDPTPHRLIMSKMRSEIGQQGVVAEAGVLSNRHLQAGWLREILETDEARRRTNVRLNVVRHWESLGGKIEPNIVNFAERVATYLSFQGISDRVLERFDHHGANQQQESVYLQLNCHACSKPVEGHHLSTGHVLKVLLGNNSFQYWLCLTPACDLVPGRKEGRGWKKNLGTWLPFKAVRLYQVDQTQALMTAASGNYLFLQIENKPKAFGFAEKADDQDRGLPTLRWEQCFAAKNGEFDSSKELQIGYIGKDGGLEHREYSSTIVSQLRYEYALNLMQRLGSHLSRVGLDFSSFRKPIA